jgi:hypothetical protein
VAFTGQEKVLLAGFFCVLFPDQRLSCIGSCSPPRQDSIGVRPINVRPNLQVALGHSLNLNEQRDNNNNDQ